MPSISDPGARPRPPARGRAVATGLAACLLGGWIAISAFHPFTPVHLQLGLDASWVAAVGEAADRGLRWGPDLAFTYGPASPLVTAYFNDAYLPLTLPLLLATCLLFGASTVLLVSPGRPGALAGTAVAAGLVAAFSVGYPDSLFLVLPLPPFLLVLSREDPGRVRFAVAAAAAVAVGMIGMAKMSFPLSALPLFLLGDAAAALRRRAPVLTVPCLLGFLAADLLYGQSLGDLPLFLRRQGEVVMGYSEAMALDGSRVELLAFAAACAALLALVVAGQAARGAARRHAATRVAVPLGLAWVLLLLFKAGFVRQDAHTLIAWFGLALAAVLATAALLGPILAGSVAFGAVVGAGLLGLSLVGPAAAPDAEERRSAAFAAEWRILAAGPAGQIAAAVDLARDPAGYAAARRAERLARRRALAGSAPLPRLEGGVDVIPSEQSRVIAAGLDFRPRPSFQEYSTYTPALIAANRAFLEGPRAPAWVLFGPEAGLGTMTLDQRYPNLAEGALWLDLLRLYRPERRIGALLALHRRDAPAPLAVAEPRRFEAGFDEVVPVDPAAGGDGPRAVFATIDVRPTLLGRLVAFLYRPPTLALNLRFADGHEETYRFVSGIGAAGFVLSPRVDNASEFEALAAGTPPPPGRIVTGFSLHVSPRLRALVEPKTAVALAPVSGGASPPFPSPGSAWSSLVAAQGESPATPYIGAPPPSVLAVPVAGLGRLDLGFGLALSEDAPQGAETICFAIAPAGGPGQTLWRRCLDRAAAPDRAPQSVSIALPPGTAEVALRATCRSGCEEGVEAYWSAPP